MDMLAIDRAVDFASNAHHGQVRKFTGEPYIEHPLRVARNVVMAGRIPSIEQWVAAVLHDTVEDTSVTIEDILAEFGLEVADLVSDLTDIATPMDGNRAARFKINLEHTRQASPAAKTVKLADVIDNVTGIARLNPKFAAVYLPEKLELLEILREGDPLLWVRAQSAINKEMRLLEETAPA